MKKAKKVLIFICIALCAACLAGAFSACSKSESFDSSGKYLVIYNGNGGYLGSKTKTERRIYVEENSKIPAYYDEYVDDPYILAGFGIATRTGYNLQGWYEQENITFKPSVTGNYIYLDAENGNGAYVADAEGTFELVYEEDENADYVQIVADDSASEDVQYVWYENEFKIYDADGDVSDYQDSYEAWGLFGYEEVSQIKGYISYTSLCDAEAFENAEKYAQMFEALPRYKAAFKEATDSDGEKYSFRSEYVDIDFMFEAAKNGSYVYENGRYVLYEEGKEGERYNVKAQYVYSSAGSPSDMEKFEAAPSEYWDFANDRVTKDTTLYAHWTKKATVRFHFPDGTYTDITTKSAGSGKTQDIVQGGTIDVLERIPSQSGKTFVAWSKSENAFDEWDFANDLYPEDSVLLDLYAYMIDGTYTRLTTKNSLEKVGENPSGKYLLAADIDFDGKVFTDTNPLGFGKNGTFTGEFISFGKKIENFTYVVDNSMKIASEASFGLFPKTDGAKIEGVTVQYEVTVKNASSAMKLGDIVFGGLVGTATNTVVKNCSVQVSIDTDDTAARTAQFTYGAVAAVAQGSSFESCAGTAAAGQSLSAAYGDKLKYVGVNP